MPTGIYVRKKGIRKGIRFNNGITLCRKCHRNKHKTDLKQL